MMRLMAAKHGWAVEDQAPQYIQAWCFSLLSPHRPPLVPPTPAYHGPRYGSRGKRLSPCRWGRLLPPGSETMRTLCCRSRPTQTGPLSPNRPPRTRTCGRLAPQPPQGNSTQSLQTRRLTSPRAADFSAPTRPRHRASRSRQF